MTKMNYTAALLLVHVFLAAAQDITDTPEEVGETTAGRCHVEAMKQAICSTIWRNMVLSVCE